MALMSTTAISFAQTSTNTQTLFGQELTDANVKSLDESGVIRCGSVEYEQYLKALYPERATNAEFESLVITKSSRDSSAKIKWCFYYGYHYQ